MDVQKDSDTKQLIPPFLNTQSELNETINGLCLNNVYLPEEIIFHIFTVAAPSDLLNYTLVCHKWNNIIKSYALWTTIYKQKYNRAAKDLPWYLYYCLLCTNYFDTNLLKNGNGQDGFNHWEVVANDGDKWAIEDLPVGADPLPLNVPEFDNKTSCFATSYGTCCKVQEIELGKSKLFQYILNSYKPHIYLSEWIAGRIDCGCMYRLQCKFKVKCGSEAFSAPSSAYHRVTQWEGSKWEKMEMAITEYPKEIETITFEHEGSDTQYWAGHFGSKMAGGVVKLLFDSIEPLESDQYGNDIPKTFSEIRLLTNGLLHNEYTTKYSITRRRCRCRVQNRRRILVEEDE